MLLGSTLNSQIPLAWAERYNAPPDMADDSRSIAVDDSGYVYVTGSGFNSAGNLDAITIKYDSLGDQVWVRNYDRGLGQNDEAMMIALDATGNVYVVGYSHGGTQGLDAMVIKYDNDGNQQWVSFYNGTANGLDEGRSIAVNSSGDVFICGYTSDAAYFYNTLTVKYNSAGVQQWAQIYNGPVGNGNDELLGLVIDGSSNVYVTGNTESAGMNYDCLTIKYDSSGSQQWLQIFDGGAGGDFGKAITLDPSNNVIVAAQSGMTNQWFDYLTIKYSNSGTQQWTARYNNGTNTFENPYAIAADNAGYVYITGQSQSTGSPSSPDATTVKYSPAGGEVWVKRYNGFNGDDRAYAIIIDDTANIYVAGYSSNGNNFDFITIKYDSAGTEEWLLRFNSQYNQGDVARAIAIKNGDVYVTGQSANTANEDFLTIRYSYSAVGISENQFSPSNMSIYPVPANSSLNIDFNGESNFESQLIISDLTGRVVMQQYSSPGIEHMILDISDLATGTYTISRITRDGNSISRVFFVKN